MKGISKFSGWVSLLLSVAMIGSAVAQPIEGNVPENKVAVVAQAIRVAGAAIDRKTTDIATASGQFAQTLIDNDVALSDIDAYVQATARTPGEYEKFHEAMQTALSGVSVADLSMAERQELMAKAFSTVTSQGLAWSGCGPVVTGMVLGVGAIVIGIIALTKDASESKLEDRYANKRDNCNTPDCEAAVEREKAAAIADIPSNKKLAGKLGVVAGGMAVVSGYILGQTAGGCFN